MRPSPLTTQAGLTFTDYFKLNLDTDEVVGYFGYGYTRAALDLPHSAEPIPWYADLSERLTASLPYVSLTSEAARREFLIAPIVLDLARYHHVQVRVEYQLDVSEQLRGSLDYYLQGLQQLLIIEAKNADLQRGFTQLAAELIALDRGMDISSPQLYGAVSIGNVWQFGVLHRDQQHITQDLNLYRVPADLHDLLQIIIAILQEPAPELV
jgi:hypothetical protein